MASLCWFVKHCQKCSLCVSSVSLFIHCFVVLFVAAAALMSSVYEDHKDEDGFLYITYSGENTFGSDSSSWQLVECLDS